MNKGSEVNQELARQRGEHFYTLYAAMGSGRSLSKLQRALADLGLSVSLNTLKSYSANYNWASRIEALPDSKEVALLTYAADMSERQSTLGRLMQTLGHERLTTIDPQEMTIAEAVRLMRVGVDIERSAMGAATSRIEVFNTAVSPLIYQIVGLFKSVNHIPDEDERVRRFVFGADNLIETAAEQVERE